MEVDGRRISDSVTREAEVCIVGAGPAGLVLARELISASVDVVIIDINMPKMDGYEVIRHMRSNSAHKTTPILVLTTESEADKKNLARAAGATGWIVKPFTQEHLLSVIDVLRHWEQDLGP